MNCRHLFQAACALSVSLLLAACGGGGGGPGVPSNGDFPQDGVTIVPGLAGFYSSEGSPSAFVLVDGAGRILGSTTRTSGLVTQRIDFSGMALVHGNNTWVLQNARVWTDVIAPGIPEIENSSNADVTGSYVPASSVTFNVPTPPRPADFPGPNATLFRFDGYQRASILLGTGTYVDDTTGASFALDASGHLGGLVKSGCTVSAGVAVVDPNRNVYTASGTLTGAGCPVGTGGVRTLLGWVDVPAFNTSYFRWGVASDTGEITMFKGLKQ